MNKTAWLNMAQEYALISDNCVTIDEVAEVDRIDAESLIGEAKE